VGNLDEGKNRKGRGKLLPKERNPTRTGNAVQKKPNWGGWGHGRKKRGGASLRDGARKASQIRYTEKPVVRNVPEGLIPWGKRRTQGGERGK